ncbi:Seven_transmembrane protein 1 [Hexamita inflata]|uniref:Seven transmembrane protein 1 n=1 Tax=Hexamita inflata TaxID=28002 RepID=A0AA86ULN6_9EUKA|nr:Seven transmembrane protein 1 [Hexamita inflata]
MICKCAVKPYSYFIATVFGLCIDNNLKWTSFIFGWISICAWLVAYFPQIRMTFLLKKSEAISNFFLASWVTGDVCNAFSVFLIPTLFTQKFLAVFFIIVDFIWVSEHLYFTNTKKKFMPLSTKMGCLELTIYIIIITFLFNDLFIYGAVGHIQLSAYEEKYQLCKEQPEGGKIQMIIGTVFAYTAAVFYISAKPAQILKTKQRKSVEGVSFANIMSTCIGNLTQALSVIVENQDISYLVEKIPFILSFLIPAFLDLISLGQFYTYREKKVSSRVLRVKDYRDTVVTVEMNDIRSDNQLQSNDHSSEMR